MSEIRTEYRFIRFEPTPGGGPKSYDCISREGEILGSTYFYSDWRKQVFEPSGTGLVFDSQCLCDILNFMAQLKGR